MPAVATFVLSLINLLASGHGILNLPPPTM
jgi:hypothetical protein